MPASESPDPCQLLQIILNLDGSLTRSLEDPRTSATSDPNLPISVLTKDLTINQSKNTWHRLSPKLQLPAANDDAVEALHWIKTSANDWLRKFVDYSDCYIMGNSAGATIAYHAGLRVAVGEVKDLEPMKIKGPILRQPFFGGTQRTESEVRLEKNPIFPMCVSDLLWELALPVGMNRGHEYYNPTVGHGPKKMEKIREVGWRVLMSGKEGGPLVDR